MVNFDTFYDELKSRNINIQVYIIIIKYFMWDIFLFFFIYNKIFITFCKFN